MSTLGRGRGRGRGLAFKAPGDIKPGIQVNASNNLSKNVSSDTKSENEKTECSQTKAASNKNNEISCVKNIFSRMSLMSEEDVLENIPGKFKFFKTEGGFDEFMSLLMQKCYQEPDFATTAAKLCNKLWNEPNLQPIFKKPFLTNAQQNYKNRAELRKKRNDSFYGLCVFLCEIYKHVKSKNQRLNPLLPFVCEILKELISSKEQQPTSDDALYFYQEMESIGKIIEEANKKELDEILNTARLKVISGEMQPSVRCRLVQVIELAASDWSLKSDINTFFEDLQQDLIVEGR